jgi:hypothetical protein
MRLLLCFLVLVCSRGGFAQEVFFKPNDVVALVGGEDMVVVSELGHLEAGIQRALPEHKLKFRSLAWEGDTVFDQHRDLNYPALEAQLEKIGATVVIAQFGQMESLAGEAKLPEFISAYERLIEKLRGPKQRRIALVAPSEWRPSNYGINLEQRQPGWAAYRNAVEAIAKRSSGECRFVDGNREIVLFGNSGARDGAHLDESTHPMFAAGIGAQLLGPTKADGARADSGLRALVVKKNRLWHDYSRPQNWAFLAGDRTNQPSSRDHKDLSKRWFPEELEHFVPLIEAKEKEIWDAAVKLKQ